LIIVLKNGFLKTAWKKNKKAVFFGKNGFLEKLEKLV